MHRAAPPFSSCYRSSCPTLPSSLPPARTRLYAPTRHRVAAAGFHASDLVAMQDRPFFPVSEAARPIARR